MWSSWPWVEENAAELAGTVGQVLEVRDDGVDAGHLGAREHHPRVDEQQMLLPLENHGVQAELAKPPQGDEPHVGIAHHAVHWTGP